MGEQPPADDPPADGPAALPAHGHRIDLTAIEAGGRFVRDSPVGGMFHRGKVSLRERAAKGSLHVSLGEGNRVSVHVDRWSPLGERRLGTRSSRYSVVRVVGHNVGIVVDAVLLVVRRRWGDQRCELECEAVCSDDHPDEESPPAP